MLGGSFNPIHLGHMSAAQAVSEKYSPEKVLFIPSAIPPHKRLDERGISTLDRLEMVRAAIAPYPQYEISTIEIERGGYSYTVDTLRALEELYPERELMLVIGTDMLYMFEKWYRFEDILKMCTLVAVGRNRGDSEGMFEMADRLRRKYGARVDVIIIDPVEISSTELREMVRSGCDISAYVPQGAAEYIKEHGLYLD